MAGSAAHPGPSLREVVAGSSSSAPGDRPMASFSSVVPGSIVRPSTSFLAATVGDSVAPGKVDISFGEVDGFPAAFISDSDMLLLAKPFARTLLGKFSGFHPPVDVIKSFVLRLRFFGKVLVDPIDKLTVSFRFSDDRDYIRFFARRFFKVFGCDMRVVKWSTFSDFLVDSPILPLWISFHGLRFQLFHAESLLDIARLFGKPLCVDYPTASLGKMAQARVLVEVDISVMHPEKVWIREWSSSAF